MHTDRSPLSRRSLARRPITLITVLAMAALLSGCIHPPYGAGGVPGGDGRHSGGGDSHHSGGGHDDGRNSDRRQDRP